MLSRTETKGPDGALPARVLFAITTLGRADEGVLVSADEQATDDAHAMKRAKRFIVRAESR